MEEKYTFEEVVGFTMNILCGIMVPAELAESIGLPIAKAIGNLKVLKTELEKARVAKEITEEGESDGRNAEAE